MTRVHPLEFGRRRASTMRAPASDARRIGTAVAVGAAILYAICGDVVFPLFALAFTTIWRIGCALMDG